MIEITQHMDIILPIALLFLAYFLRLFIDKSVDKLDFIKSACEFPVDIIFLSLSFLITFILTQNERQIEGLLYFIIYIICAIIMVFLRRRSIYKLESKKGIWLAFLSANLVLALIALFGSINLLTNKYEQSKRDTEPTEINNPIEKAEDDL